MVASCGDDSAGVEVVAPLTITVTPTDLVLSTGASAQLEATVHDSDGRLLPGHAVQWSSSAPEIVGVSQTGIVTALAVGRATIGAYRDQSVGFGRVAVQPGFRIPVSSTSRWLVVTEVGSLEPGCVGNEGGLRIDGSRDCSHAGVSRYSLDLADADQWTGAAPGTPAPEVVAAADGTITDICIQPPSEVTCGDNGPFVLIAHEAGFSTVYAHLDPGSVSLRRKTAVQQGQRLGTMGAYGAFHSPWLHFELRYENSGSMAASVLEPVQVSGRRMRDYRAGDGRDSLHARRSVSLRRTICPPCSGGLTAEAARR
ncbi:MAG TPA: peptidoglycan DD-metalloendopeptidase family protein [Gemmatimonadales bacterium]|nr:peptidoglycan DD-metalloendopeptidase family protein [Gemmatimonadales bacterium]